MSDVAYLVQTYLDAWNETDPATRRTLLERVWAADGRYVDPLADVTGPTAIDAVIAAAQGQFPGLCFRLRLAGDVDAHHDVARFTWELGPADGEAVVVGFDVAVVVDGRFQAVAGFLDKVPA